MKIYQTRTTINCHTRLVKYTFRGSRFESGGKVEREEVSENDEPIAFDGERGKDNVGVVGVVAGGLVEELVVVVLADTATDSLVNGGGVLDKFFMLAITISAKRSGWIFAMSVSSCSVALSPAAMKTPITAIICSTGVNSQSNKGSLLLGSSTPLAGP